MDFFWNLNQEKRIGDSSDLARSASGKAEGAAAQVRQLEDRLDRLALVNRALWEMLQDATGATDEELRARIKEIDERDGSADGKITPQRRDCPNCSRPIGAKARHCVYCGSKVAAEDPFS